MYKEEFIEEGIVAEVNSGTANVNIVDSGGCEECSAKIICKPKNDNERSLIVKDPFGVNPGDKVRVSIKGRNILSATFILYGVPLLLLLGGIFFGMNFFKTNPELYSSLLGLGFSAIFLAIIFIGSKLQKIKVKTIPIITFVSKKVPQN